MKNTKKPQLFKVASPKLKVKTIGYINLMARNKAEIGRNGTPKLYRSKITLRAANVAQKLKDKANKLFNQCFAQAALLEAKVLEARKQIQEARKHILTTLNHFALHCKLLKAYKHLNIFKYSLPRNIRINLF